MTELAPNPRPDAGDALEEIGRAARAHAAAPAGELWALPPSDAPVAARLLALGAAGLGGFADGGVDDRGVWLARRPAGQTLDGLGKRERLPWAQAIGVVRALARALAAAEKAGLFPGALRPAEIALADDGAFFLAEPLVRALVGAAKDARATSAPSPRWTPPEQTEGAPWDAAANRYVLGLVAYRLVSGAMPFGGAGLRHAMRQQGEAAAPFEEEIARALRPGVQSFVLRMLAPDARERPRSAEEIATQCAELLGEVAAAAVPATKAVPVAPPKAEARARAIPARRVAPSRWLAAVPIALGLALAAALVATAAAPAKSTIAATPLPMRPSPPLTSATSQECTACHARQVAEWQRSVMAHAVRSPLFGALESVVEEQVGKDERCPNGAGILRRIGGDVCRDERTGITLTGSGGEHWCVNCHAPGENLGRDGRGSMPAWSAFSDRRARAPIRDLVAASSLEGISCAGCHTTIGPVAAHGALGRAQGASYEGNPTWTSFVTGQTFRARPEDFQGRAGIANSGYQLDGRSFFGASLGLGEPIVHRRASNETRAYLSSSEFCGACHDVRLFGTDAVGVRERGDHFKRLRNGYTEWREWAESEKRSGRIAPTCQGCHMSLYPGVCVPNQGLAGKGSQGSGCPTGTHFEARAAGEEARARASASSDKDTRSASHYFTSVELPLANEFKDLFADETTLDAAGLPLGLRARRDILLSHTFRFELAAPRRSGARLEIPVVIQNTGAGHRVPGGFSQEREVWVELTVKDARGNVVYEVGRLAAPDADLRDKLFLRVTTSDDALDARGRPLGLFGADVVDGPDVPAWSPNPARGGTTFRGRGLVNLQNGFLRCVRCIGFVDGAGKCQAAPGQGRTRADRFGDGAYDLDTGECRSNLSGGSELFETYFPVGALDAERGVAKAPDAIIDTRSAPPGVVLTYTYDLDAGAHPPPFEVDARLRFRSFPPYLLRAFAAYEARKAAQGLRPSGAQVTLDMLRRVEVTDVGDAHARIP
jgi:eukaryotic-like serine/threonine-protein kinase